MPYVLFISLAVLFGACHEAPVGGIRQLENHQPVTLVNNTIEGDTSVADTPESVDTTDTFVEDTFILNVSDTITTSETDTVIEGDTTPTDTRVPDTTPMETVVDTQVEETPDTEAPPDTTPVAETVSPECESDFDCDGSDELCFDGKCLTALDICTAHVPDQVYPDLGLCCVKQHPLFVNGGLCYTSITLDEIVFYECVEYDGNLTIEGTSCVDQDEDTVDSCDPYDGCDNTSIDPDPDGDGIDNEYDWCEDEAEVYDLYEDEDGCPEEDQDHDGWSVEQGDCDDDSTMDGPLATYCEDEFGFYIMINSYVDGPFYPECLADSWAVFYTDGSFFNGPHIEGQDYPGDDYDNDCDGQTDEAGESGLIDCWWYELGEFVSMVECPFMTEELLP